VEIEIAEFRYVFKFRRDIACDRVEVLGGSDLEYLLEEPSGISVHLEIAVAQRHRVARVLPLRIPSGQWRGRLCLLERGNMLRESFERSISLRIPEHPAWTPRLIDILSGDIYALNEADVVPRAHIFAKKQGDDDHFGGSGQTWRYGVLPASAASGSCSAISAASKRVSSLHSSTHPSSLPFGKGGYLLPPLDFYNERYILFNLSQL